MFSFFIFMFGELNKKTLAMTEWQTLFVLAFWPIKATRHFEKWFDGKTHDIIVH